MITILGPTASGKTRLAVSLAIRIDGYTHETTTDMRVGIATFTSGTWRQWDPTGLL